MFVCPIKTQEILDRFTNNDFNNDANNNDSNNDNDDNNNAINFREAY